MSQPIEILQVKLITKGDYTNNFIFSPNEVIFFTTNTFLNKSILNANEIKLKAVFLSREVFDKAIALLKSSDYGTYTKEQIEKNNIELFRTSVLAAKEQISVGSGKMSIVSSKYVPESFKKNTSYNKNKNVVQYFISFEVFLLDPRRNLTDEDFKRASCKLKAADLNQQAKEIFGISLGLDSEIPNRAIRAVPNSNSIYGNSSYGNSSYGNYGNSSYGNSSYGNSSYGNYGTPISSDVINTRKAIREWLKDYEKKVKNDNREKLINEWQNYKEQQTISNLPVTRMNEWITKHEQEYLENKYRIEWLTYKEQQERLGKRVDLETWFKDKLEEERENKVEKYMKEWNDYKSDQVLLGKIANMNEWLKLRVMKRNDLYYQGGYNRKRNNINKKTINKKYIKKKTKTKANPRIKPKHLTRSKRLIYA
jgi:hypothetical protein